MQARRLAPGAVFSTRARKCTGDGVRTYKGHRGYSRRGRPGGQRRSGSQQG